MSQCEGRDIFPCLPPTVKLVWRSAVSWVCSADRSCSDLSVLRLSKYFRKAGDCSLRKTGQRLL